MADLPLHEYAGRIERISDIAASDFRRAIGDSAAQREACCRYFKTGYQANLSAAELLDFLAVSSPSILDLAGYSEDQVQSIMDVVARLTEDEIASAQP